MDEAGIMFIFQNVWNTRSGAEVIEMRGHEDGVMSVNFSSDGHQIVSGSYDNTV